MIWASPVWGHAISSDFLHWTYLPAALIPDQPYDEDGVFSGSAAWTAHGTPFVYYTGPFLLNCNRIEAPLAEAHTPLRGEDSQKNAREICNVSQLCAII